MKKLLSIALLVLGAVAVNAQVWLTDVLTPKDIKCATTFKSTLNPEDCLEMCHLYKVKAGIWMGGNYNNEPKYIVYDLEGKYDKLSFWVGGHYCSGCTEDEATAA